MNENLERQNIELILGRKLFDYEWFAMKIAGKILEDMDNKKKSVEGILNHCKGSKEQLRGYRPNSLIIDNYVNLEK